ncbi:MAG: hypothetical protein ACRBB0_18225 [Pelagimonas sp.]|uniref:hypothetical protein n=1 Tax=Pelagimonas sp. TaxID=2073170 RepID=UPI003D6C5185
MFGFLKMFGTDPAQARRDEAVTRLDTAAENFRRAAEACAAPQSQVFWHLAGATSELRNRIAAAPGQIAPLRKLIFHFIPQMSEICLRWARLATANPLADPDPKALEEFGAYLALIRDAEQSCLTKRYDALHMSMQVMEGQMKRHIS